MKPFEITHELADDAALVVRAGGKFDRDAGSAVEALIQEHSGVSVLNLGGVSYISSSGIAILVKLSTSFGLRIASPAQCVVDTLSLAGIERILSIHEDEAAARHAEH